MGPKPFIHKDEATLLLEDVRQAVIASKVLSYIQGFYLMEYASNQYQLGFDFASIAKVWSAGCIIQGELIHTIQEEFAVSGVVSLQDSTVLNDLLVNAVASWKEVCEMSVTFDIHIPVISAALTEYIGMYTPKLSTNLLQAMRDLFGGHTYQRDDKEGVFHTEWKS